ncbi:MAG: hypothetical protein WC725_03295 [Patescibacteria group bacterium]|jgi:hypothetical protein
MSPERPGFRPPEMNDNPKPTTEEIKNDGWLGKIRKTMGEKIALAGLVGTLAGSPESAEAQPQKNKAEHSHRLKAYDGPVLINVNAEKEYAARHKKYQQLSNPDQAELEDRIQTEKSNTRELEHFIKEIKKSHPGKEGQAIINELLNITGSTVDGSGTVTSTVMDAFEAQYLIRNHSKFYKVTLESAK